MLNLDLILDSLKQGPDDPPKDNEEWYKGLRFADCPDCGRVFIYNNRCGKCAGAQWLPVGYVTRRKPREPEE